MNEFKLIELLMTSPLIYVAFAIAVWLLTYLFKQPVKFYTAKIKDEKTRKLVNKWILLIPFVLALVLVIVYYGLATNVWFDDWEKLLSDAFSIAMLSIVIYNVFQDIKGKKSEYEITEDGKQVFALLYVYAKDKNKVRMLLDQCKENYNNSNFTISDTVKGWLPEKVDEDVVNTIVKAIKIYLDNLKKQGESEGIIDEIL